MTDELKKTIENHKKMWTYIKEHEEEYCWAPSLERRGILKSNYLFISGIIDEPRNKCFLCEYAETMRRRSGAGSFMCEYCPCLWGSETKASAFYCESYKEGCVIWGRSPADDIINLPIKPELL